MVLYPTLSGLFLIRQELTKVINWVPGGSDGKESACNAGDLGLTPGSGRSPGEGSGYPFQYACLENSLDREAWKATFHGVTKSWTLTERPSTAQHWKIPRAKEHGNIYQHQRVNTGWVRSSFVNSWWKSTYYTNIYLNIITIFPGSPQG